MEIKVSIIVPSYKRTKEFFSRAIQSLLNQSYENIEIVVIDDNAKQEHMEYRQALSEYINELNSDKIVYVQNKENLGGAVSRNVGIENASGEYITFLDDDDKYLKDKVKHQLEYMIENELDMSFTNIIICNEKDKVVDYREHSKIKSLDNEYLLRYHMTRQITATNTFMYTREAILKIGGFIKVPVGQEFYLMTNTIKSDLKIGYADFNDVILYRQGQECISNGANKISGEINVFNFKKSHFKFLTFCEKKYVKFRHSAVMAVIHIRQKHYFKAIGRMFMAFFISPVNCLKSVFEMLNASNNIGKKFDLIEE